MMLQDRLLALAMVGDRWVLYLLVALSVLCIAIAVERLVYAVLHRTPGPALDAVVQGYLRSGDMAEALGTLGSLRGVEARVLLAGLRAGAEGGSESAEEAFTATMAFERLALERGLIVLGTTGANAPFIGLFGTVLGIIKAFHELSLEAAEATAAVMAGISEALVATAMGLLVAIPAVVLYNAFQRRNKERLARIESLAHLLLARLKARNPAEHLGAPREAREA